MMHQFVHIDLTYLNLLSDGDESFKREMLAAFASYYPQMVAAIKESLNSNDAESFRHAVHKAKSPSRMIGLNEICDKLDAIELEIVETGLIPERSEAIVLEFVSKGEEALEEIKQALA